MAALLTSNRVLIAFLLGLAMLPLFAAQFTVTIVNYIGLYALVALGLVLLTGIGGLTSFGQAAFVGLGAYATAYLTTRHGMSPWGTLIVGMVITTAVSLALGFITLRLSGHFLPLGTIAWGISLYFIFGNVQALGGHGGIDGIPPMRWRWPWPCSPRAPPKSLNGRWWWRWAVCTPAAPPWWIGTASPASRTMLPS